MEQNARPDFYDGQYLGAADLDAVVDYHRIQQARHTVGAHTWGIGAGLELREGKLPIGDVDVSVLPGIAWDGYGRAIVVLAPTRIGTDRFVNFQATTPPEGQLIKVWLRYVEAPSGGPAPGFEVCRADGQFSRAVAGFAIEVGEPAVPPHGSVIVAGRSLDALKVRAAFFPSVPDLFDESVPYQEFPEGGSRPIWLVPIGYVRWLKLTGQPGRLIARNDSGAGGTVPDTDRMRAFRQYIGVVAEGIEAVDGLIRLRDRGKNPDPLVSHVRPPRMAIDPAKPPENDLVWVEGHFHVLGDARVSGGRIELRDSAASTGGVPLLLRRVEANALGGKDLQVLVGAENTPHGAHVFAVGPGKLDAATGQLKPDFTPCLVVRDDGTVGVGIGAPPQLLTLGGDKKTRLELGRVSATLPWASTNAAKNGDGSFVINHQAQGSDYEGADFGLMRDRKLRVVLLDHDTRVSSQGGDVVISVNYAEPGDTEVLRVKAGGASITGTLHVSGTITGPTPKQFLIPHPLGPKTRSLVHACLEGPEAAVFYRGEAQLRDGRATVDLPNYFEALTRSDDRTVLITPIVDGDEAASALAATRVADGRFTVRMITPGNPSQRFCWEVKGVRGDVPALQTELDRVAALDPREAVEAGARR